MRHKRSTGSTADDTRRTAWRSSTTCAPRAGAGLAGSRRATLSTMPTRSTANFSDDPDVHRMGGPHTGRASSDGRSCRRSRRCLHTGSVGHASRRYRERSRSTPRTRSKPVRWCPCGHTNVVRFAVRMGPYRHTATRLCGRHLCGRSRWSR